MRRIGATAAGAVLSIALALGVRAGGGSEYDRSSFYAQDALWDASSLQRAGADSASGSNAAKYAWKKINGVIYNGSGVKIPGAVARGIDVSAWQGEINWEKVKSSDVDFAMIRIGHGLRYRDSCFEENMEGAALAGIPAGCYVYSAAANEAEAILEAQMAIERMEGLRVSYPVAYDIEDEALAQRLSRKELTNMAIAFCSEIRKAGYYPIVYCNANWYKNHLDMGRLSAYDCWLAWYSDKMISPDKTDYTYGIWQSTCGDGDVLRSTKGLISGISGAVDLDIGFVDYTKKITPRTMASVDYVKTPVYMQGWYDIEGQTYYFRNGQRVTGARKIGNNTYSFALSDGHLYKNTLLYSKATGKTIYCDENGVHARNTWVTHQGKTYYFGADSYAYLGSRNINGKFYLFNKTYGYLYTNYKVVSKNMDVAYYGADGARIRNSFQPIEEKGVVRTYYFGQNYLAYKGWHRINGKLYYFYAGRNAYAGSRIENRTVILSGRKCVFDENGVCVSREPL